jgi:hypothetical protein
MILPKQQAITVVVSPDSFLQNISPIRCVSEIAKAVQANFLKTRKELDLNLALKNAMDKLK